MKITETDKKAYERMKAGVITAKGFLGKDSRPVPEIIQADSVAMRKQGLDFDSAADALERLKNEGSKGLGESITVDNTLLVKTGDARGVLPCPWDDGVFHKNSVVVENPANKTTLVYSDLSIHMLRSHHFCQGEGSDFRLDPEAMKNLLG